MPLENLTKNESVGEYLKEILGSNDDSLFIDSYLAANLETKLSKISFSISTNSALLLLDFDTSIPPPRKKRSAVFNIFPSELNSALLRSS